MPPASVEEALQRARRHGRAAVAETLSAVRAVLDAAALAASGRPSQAHRMLAPLAALLEDLAAQLGADGRDGGELLAALADALDDEIRRWEGRAGDDADARAVLRAFLGLRELLWEFGLRRPGEDPPPRKPARRRGRAHVQRVRVEG